MEALLNKAYNDLSEDDEALERKIQAELDNLPFNNESSPLNKSNHSISFLQNASFLNESLDLKQKLQGFREANEKMCKKFEKNIKVLKEITEQIREKEPIIQEVLKSKDLQVNMDIKTEEFYQKKEKNDKKPLFMKKMSFKEDILIENYEKGALNVENPLNTKEILNTQTINQLTAFLKPKNKQKNFKKAPEIEEITLNQELEWFRMEKEDFLSQKHEEFLLKAQFSFISYRIPFIIPTLPSKTPAINLEKASFIQFTSKIELLKPLIPSESTLLPKNSKEICILSLKSLINPLKRPSPLIKPLQKPLLLEKPHYLKESSPLIIDIQFNKSNPPLKHDFFIEKTLSLIEILQKELNLSKILPLLQYKGIITPKIPLYLEETPFYSHNENNTSISSFITRLSDKQKGSLHSLVIKLEKLNDLTGLSSLKSLKSLVLSVNKLDSSIKALFPSTLIHIDLSQNLIKDYSFLKGLPNLKTLVLEMNLIERIAPLNESSCLETLILNKNKVKNIENLGFCKELRVLRLYQNEIEIIKGLEGLFLLEEINLGRNRIKEVSGLKELVSLRKLILFNNEIEDFKEDFRFFLLNELYLNNNRIKNIEKLRFLPCLEVLNLENNEISYFDEKNMIFTPNLKILKVGFNKMGSFLTVFNMISKGNNLKTLDYGENPFMNEISEKTKEFYEDFLYEKCLFLKEINNNVRKGDFEVINKDFKENSVFNDYMKVFRLIIQEFSFISQLEGLKFKKSAFLHTKAFETRRKSLSFIHLSLIKSLIPQNNSFYNENDLFELKYQYFSNKIKAFLLRTIYSKRKRLIFLKKNLLSIIKIQSLFRKALIRKKYPFLGGNKQGKYLKIQNIAVLKIQKVFRGFLLRKRKEKLFKGILYEDNEIDDMKEVDIAFFNQKSENTMDFQLKIPDFLLDNDEKASNHNKKVLLPPINNINKDSLKEKGSFLNDNYMKSPNLVRLRENHEDSLDLHDKSSILSYKSSKTLNLPKIIQRKEENDNKADKIMKEWGFIKPELKETLAYKLEKERKRKEGKDRKALTSEERYLKFMKTIKKH